MRPPPRVISTVVVALALAALAAPSLARADGDPASDILPLQDVYLPYSPTVSAPVATALRKLLKQTRAAGYPVKVAIIATPADLGAVPDKFGQPQAYAAFLGSEISFNGRTPLLVVMPSGYGVLNVQQRAATALSSLKPPSGSGADALARAGIDGVVRLASATGHRVAAPKVAGGGSSGGGAPPALVFGAPVLLLVVAGLLAALRRRRSDDEPRLRTDDQQAPRAEV